VGSVYHSVAKPPIVSMRHGYSTSLESRQRRTIGMATSQQQGYLSSCQATFMCRTKVSKWAWSIIDHRRTTATTWRLRGRWSCSWTREISWSV